MWGFLPYIQDLKFRKLYDNLLKNIVGILNRVPKKTQHGHLNYIFTRLILELNPQNYKEFNAVIGVLESVKLEFYRRLVSKYEDKKIEENTDVY